MDTLLITGSSGLIGSAVAARFARRYPVVGFDVVPPKTPASAEFVKVDFTSDESVAAGLNQIRQCHGERIASVIHLAAYYDFTGEPSPKYDEITVRGTERLLQGLQEFTVGQFVVSSTMLVHAPCRPGERITEEWPLETKWAYPESKLRTESLIRQRRGSVPIVVLRMAGVYDDRCHSIPIAHQIDRIRARTPTSHLFSGDTSHGQSFLHLEDLVDALDRVVERRPALPSDVTLLLGEPEVVSYDALQRELGRLIHGTDDWVTLEIPKPLAKAGAWLQEMMPLAGDPFIKPFMIDIADDHYALDITRARDLLDWEPKRSLRETLPAMVAALNADPVRWYRENKLGVPADLLEPAARRKRAAGEPALPPLGALALVIGGFGLGVLASRLFESRQTSDAGRQ